jgi:hypothetical protein
LPAPSKTFSAVGSSRISEFQQQEEKFVCSELDENDIIHTKLFRLLSGITEKIW